eukprot:CAMPEP_0167756786 /NCGR_PEP_ID=MMETSP0110_2-20121227/9573_1 /TAXON_ID=629695 /ORGANISM="Gymnochlora sp., Strain CCMP2014" /LENGTH=944 /DNA_ID=CAMNT_0007642923 /DNA_START=87 /DNA_END=2921 /DNA_ORIENTATION=-
MSSSPAPKQKARRGHRPRTVEVKCIEAKLPSSKGDAKTLVSRRVYARVMLLDMQRVTDLNRDLSHPKWNQSFTFSLKNESTGGRLLPSTALSISLWAHSPSEIKDSIIGRALIPISEYPPDEEVEGWYALTDGKKGEAGGVKLSICGTECRSAWTLHREQKKGKIIRSPRSRKANVPAVTVPNDGSYYRELVQFFEEDKNIEFVAQQIVSSEVRSDGFCESVLSVLQAFHPFRRTVTFVCKIAEIELEMKQDPMSLYRGNGHTSKVFSSVARKAGRKYLASFRPLINKVFSNKKPCEIVPKKIKKGEMLSKNVINLQGLCEIFMRHISSSASRIPEPIRWIGVGIEKVLRQYSESVVSRCLSSLFFLRFLCPAIVTPKQYGIVDKPVPPRALRTLMLITKSLQRLANMQIETSTMVSINSSKKHIPRVKEPYMVVMDDFFQRNEQPMQGFLSRLTRVAEHIRPTAGYFSPDDYMTGALRKIHIRFDKIYSARHKHKIRVHVAPYLPTPRAPKTKAPQLPKSRGHHIRAASVLIGGKSLNVTPDGVTRNRSETASNNSISNYSTPVTQGSSKNISPFSPYRVRLRAKSPPPIPSEQPDALRHLRKRLADAIISPTASPKSQPKRKNLNLVVKTSPSVGEMKKSKLVNDPSTPLSFTSLLTRMGAPPSSPLPVSPKPSVPTPTREHPHTPQNGAPSPKRLHNRKRSISSSNVLNVENTVRSKYLSANKSKRSHQRRFSWMGILNVLRGVPSDPKGSHTQPAISQPVSRDLSAELSGETSRSEDVKPNPERKKKSSSFNGSDRLNLPGNDENQSVSTDLTETDNSEEEKESVRKLKSKITTKERLIALQLTRIRHLEACLSRVNRSRKKRMNISQSGPSLPVISISESKESELGFVRSSSGQNIASLTSPPPSSPISGVIGTEGIGRARKTPPSTLRKGEASMSSLT